MTVTLQWIVLKLFVDDQEQHDVIDVNKSHRWFPHSVSHRKNVQFQMINAQNRVR